MFTQAQHQYLAYVAKQDEQVKVYPYDPRILQCFEKLMSDLRGASIDLEVRFMGSAALGIPGRGDLDIYLLCPVDQQPHYIARLNLLYGPEKYMIQMVKWQTYIDHYEVEIFLANQTNPILQEQIMFYETLKRDRTLRDEYEDIKRSAEGLSLSEYTAAKYRFFNRVLGPAGAVHAVPHHLFT